MHSPMTVAPPVLLLTHRTWHQARGVLLPSAPTPHLRAQTSSPRFLPSPGPFSAAFPPYHFLNVS